MSEQGRSPWWSSGADDLDDITDPFAAYRAARTSTDAGAATDAPATDAPATDDPATDDPGAGATGTGRPWDVPWEDWDDRDPHPPDGAQRPTMDDALDVMQAFARLLASRRGGRSGIRPHPREQTCRACPWCIAVRSLGDARPEVVDHLDEALRHLVAAARAWVDAAESRGSWQRIELDDDGPDGG